MKKIIFTLSLLSVVGFAVAQKKPAQAHPVLSATAAKGSAAANTPTSATVGTDASFATAAKQQEAAQPATTPEANTKKGSANKPQQTPRLVRGKN